jgi:hypothetical protein
VRRTGRRGPRYTTRSPGLPISVYGAFQRRRLSIAGTSTPSAKGGDIGSHRRLTGSFRDHRTHTLCPELPLANADSGRSSRMPKMRKQSFVTQNRFLNMVGGRAAVAAVKLGRYWAYTVNNWTPANRSAPPPRASRHHPIFLDCWSRWSDGGNFSRDARGITTLTTCQSGYERLQRGIEFGISKPITRCDNLCRQHPLTSQ